jgi:hypothetical protein
MTTKQMVHQFLQDFHSKLSIWSVAFRDDRGKNMQTLLDLDITPIYREGILKELRTEDYSEGPIEEKLHGNSSMWVFGKLVKSREVYIKISLGLSGLQVICVSFHIAEYVMKYPFK